jgi:hypothetical protein
MAVTVCTLARSNFVIAPIRDRLGTPAEGVVKYGMARAFNGAVLHTDGGALEVLFFESGQTVAGDPGYLVRRPDLTVRVTTEPGAAGLLPSSEFVRLVEGADQEFDRRLKQGEGEPNFLVRRLYLLASLPIGPNVEQSAEQL